MNYFRCVSILLAVMLGAGALWLLAAPGHYKKLAARFIPENRPALFVVSSVLISCWVAYTWFRFLAFKNIPAAAVSIILSLTLVKGYFALFYYRSFRQFAGKFLALDDALLRTFAVFYMALALALFALGTALNG